MSIMFIDDDTKISQCNCSLYNKEVFIESTLDNISQLLNSVDYEIIVVENGSTDNSKIVLENYIISEIIFS